MSTTAWFLLWALSIVVTGLSCAGLMWYFVRKAQDQWRPPW